MSKQTQTLTAALLLSLGVSFIPARVLAHHSFSAEFSRDLPIEVTGTVVNVEWTNPHARFYIESKDEDGETVTWNFELMTPNILMRQGWTSNSLKLGDTVTVNGWRARNDPHVAAAGSVTLPDGTRLFSGTANN